MKFLLDAFCLDGGQMLAGGLEVRCTLEEEMACYEQNINYANCSVKSILYENYLRLADKFYAIWVYNCIKVLLKSS